MLHGLAALVGALSVLTGAPCAGINNTSNAAVWTEGHTTWVETLGTHYADDGDGLTALQSGRRVPLARVPYGPGPRLAMRRAEAALQVGPRGPKTRIACAWEVPIEG